MRGDCGRLLIVLVLAAAVAAALASTPSAANKWRNCGKISSDPNPIVVSALEPTPCKTAMTIMRELWRGPKGAVVSHNGGSGADGWMTLKRYPGWRCTSGSGGGGCRKGSLSVGYQN